MNFESVRKIIVNLNDRDRVVNTREIPYDGKLSDEELVVLVKRVHEERVEGLQALMQISTKLEQKNEVESHHKLGLVFLRNGMGREALEELRRALALESDNASVLNDFGLASMLVENFSQAEETFRRAIELRPNYPDLHNNFGAALLQLARYPEALQEFETALGIHSGYAEAHFNLGLCLLTQSLGNGKMPEDVEGRMQTHLARAVELNASYDNQYYKVAQNYLAKDQYPEARQALNECKTSVSALTGSEIYHEFYLRLKYGDEGVDRGATERYIAKLEELLQKNPNFVDVHNDLGVAYLIQCRFLFNRAINEFKHALAINPDYAKARKNFKLAENEGKGFLILLRAILYF